MWAGTRKLVAFVHYLRFGSIAGGCQPTAHQRRRAATISVWFIRNATTVARPIAVVPSIFVPSRLQTKWSCQCCCRGWNRGTDFCVSGSMVRIVFVLNSLHVRHARQTLSKVVSPRRDAGMMWSYVSGIPLTASLVRQ
jgi:hypothetical protein